MPKPKKAALKQEAEEVVEQVSSAPTDKEILTDLYEKMKTYGINSISDVEVKLSRL